MPTTPKTSRPTEKGSGAGGRSRAKPATNSGRWRELQEVLAKPAAGREESLAATRAASRYARCLMEVCPDPLMAVGPDGRITDANEAGSRLTGLPREELIGSDFAHHFAEPEKARAAYQAAAARGFAAGQSLAVRHATGTLTDVLLSARAHLDENHQLAGVLAAARNLTKENQRQSELARLEARLVFQSEELKRRESEIQQISKLYDVLQTCNSQKEAYPVIGAVALELFPGSSGALAVAVNRNWELETVAEWGPDRRMLAGFTLDDCWALRRGQAREVPQPGTPSECRHFQAAPQTPYLCLPLTVRGELQGLLNLRAAPDHRIHDPQRHLLASLGEVVKLSLSNLKLREELRAQAIKDPLTGLFNRRYLEETLRRELARCERRQTPLCVAVLDIDGFKAFNDRHGHAAGDAALKALGAFFQARLRASDIACRYGGDEFVLVLPDTELEHVVARMEQLCSEIQSLPCVYEGGVLPSLSVSMGMAQWPAHASTLEELIQAADRALYAAKSSGRNRTAVYNERTGQPPAEAVPPATVPPAAPAPAPAGHPDPDGMDRA